MDILRKTWSKSQTSIKLHASNFILLMEKIKIWECPVLAGNGKYQTINYAAQDWKCHSENQEIFRNIFAALLVDVGDWKMSL